MISSSETSVKRTPLHDVHVSAGARMVEFAGWRMPLRYSGVIEEHCAVRGRAGLFDVSHMGEVAVRGDQALRFLQFVTCNDVARMRPGRAQYNGLTLPNGAFVDDLLIYMLADGDYLLVVNAANTAKDFAWLQEHAGSYEVDVRDVSAEWAQLALQGPRALEILRPLANGDLLDGLRYYRFARTEVAGAPCILSRTGYTGEDGFEVYVGPADARRVWAAILDAGEAHGIARIGLAARDTLRLEAKMALYGQDIDDTTTVLEADLGWILKLDKGEFIGREVLVRQAAAGVSRKLVGFEIQGRGIARHGHCALHGGRVVGAVTSGTLAPFLKRSIGLVYLPVELAQLGRKFEIEIRGKQHDARVVATPFYKRAR